MPLAAKRISPDRVQFDDSLTTREIETLVTDRQVRVLQACEPVSARKWAELNARFFAARPDVQLRIFGFYSSVCDLSFLRAMGNVRHFSADSLRKVHSIQAIARLPSLRSLGVGVFELQDFAFLADLSTEIEAIYLGATRSRKPSLRLLERFRRLQTLSLEGHRKDIDALSPLVELEDLTLRSITVSDFSFLRPLSKLWSLDIKLGGSNNLQSLSDLENIKYLELWQVRALADLQPISTLVGLQYLFLQSLPHVRALPNLSRLTKLRRVHLDNMKGLQNLDELSDAPALEEVIHVDARGHDPAEYECLLKKPTTKAFCVGFGGDAKNETFRAMLKTHGKAWYEFGPFEFQG